jgi:hypothetical protein
MEYKIWQEKRNDKHALVSSQQDTRVKSDWSYSHPWWPLLLFLKKILFFSILTAFSFSRCLCVRHPSCIPFSLIFSSVYHHTPTDYWKSYDIMIGIFNISVTRSEASKSCTNGVWHKLWPDCIPDLQEHNTTLVSITQNVTVSKGNRTR